MRNLNRRVEVDNEPVARVARDALGTLGLLAPAAADKGGSPTGKRAGLAAYLWAERGTLLGLTARHVFLVIVSLAAAIAVALPLGLGLERLRGGAEAVIRAVGVLQTMPGIALLAFMIPLLGIGVVPALTALFLYSLYPILRNTYTGVRDAAPDAVSAATALGMTPRQVLRYVRLPLAAPLIMAGIRTAAVINVGTATLAAFIGAGGLGDPIASGLALSDTRMILSGALPAAALALVVDAALGACERLVRPGGG
jgi:osmoprotectant transport system permease protein